LDNQININILCNAAGIGGAKDFPDLSPDELRNMARVNLESMVITTSLFIPLLKKAAPSYILNVGSMAGLSPIPIKSVYAATKSAIISFSHSLKYILKPYNISVSCLCPGPVFTKPSIEKETIEKMGWIGMKMAIKSERVGDSAIRQMLNNKMIIIPGKLATLLSIIIRILPKSFIAGIIYRRNKKGNYL
jgi:uncharacterized protein